MSNSLRIIIFINLLWFITINWEGYWALRIQSVDDRAIGQLILNHPNRDFKELRDLNHCITLTLKNSEAPTAYISPDDATITWLYRGGIFFLSDLNVEIGSHYDKKIIVENITDIIESCGG